MKRGPRPPSAAVSWPRPTVSVTGSSAIPTEASVPATTMRPSPLSGAMNPSPHGRFPNIPGSVSTPSSDIPSRPARSSVKSVPRGQVIRASRAPVRSLATSAERLAIWSKSPAIIRASMSSVTPGIVAPRAPASLAFLRATV